MAQAQIDIARLNETVREESLQVQTAVNEIKKVIVGQRCLVDRMMVALLCRGHLLVEGVPGPGQDAGREDPGPGARPPVLAHPVHARPAARRPHRHAVYDQKTGEFVARKGPIFTNLLLADEINRAPAKVQSALLEAMQERQVTLGDTTHPLPEPFLVLATQNPIEQEGTYPLPEAQVDRFLLKVKVDYPKPGGGAADPRPHDDRRGPCGRARARGRRDPPARPARARGLPRRADPRLHRGAGARPRAAARGRACRPRAR